MTTTQLARGLVWGWSVSRRLLLVILIVFISLVAAIALMLLSGLAVGLSLMAVFAVLTVWRPHYGLYITVWLTTALEGTWGDPLFHYGWLLQSSISTTTGIQAFIFTPLEMMLILVASVIIIRRTISRRPLYTNHLSWITLVFMALMTGSIVYGVLQTGGDFNIALWETRNIYIAGLLVFLVPNVLTSRGQLVHMVNLMIGAVIVLAAGIVWRRMVVLSDGDRLDLEFAHETPLFISTVIVFLLARLIWPARFGQRLTVLWAPFLLWAMMLTERRAGWICLDIALILLGAITFRMRRRVFWLAVMPLILLYGGYVAAFWGATGPAAQPARAVRSINDPDKRDEASNLYRLIETANVRANILSEPITGLGIGQQYIFYLPMPDLSWWAFWHYVPHNGFLWVWLKMGVFGFMCFLTLIGASIVCGLQLIKRAGGDSSAPVLVALFSVVPMTLVYCYVDISLMSVRAMLLLGVAIGSLGAWAVLSQETVPQLKRPGS